MGTRRWCSDPVAGRADAVVLAIYRSAAYRASQGGVAHTDTMAVFVSDMGERRKTPLTCGPASSARQRESRRAAAAVGYRELGRPSRPKKEEGAGRACWRAGPEGGKQAEWARSQAERG